MGWISGRGITRAAWRGLAAGAAGLLLGGCPALGPSADEAARSLSERRAPGFTRLEEQPVDTPVAIVNGQVIVDVTLDDVGPLGFLLDTGSGRSLIDPRVASAFPERLVPGVTRVEDSNGAVSRAAEELRAGRLQVGDASFEDVRLLLVQLPEAFAKNDIVGILGFDVFADTLLTIDYCRSVIRLEAGALEESNDVTPYELDQSLPFVDFSIGEEAVRGLLDTGFTGFVDLPDEVAPGAFAAGPVPWVRSFGLFSSSRTQIGRLATSLTFAARQIDSAVVTVSAGREYALLGSDLLDEFVVTIDQSSQQIRLARASDAPIETRAPRHAGFEVAFVEPRRQFVVSDVIPQTPAEQLGVRVGDVLLAVSGVELAPASEGGAAITVVPELGDVQRLDVTLQRGVEVIELSIPVFDLDALGE
jgi:predicted aspartyl protease